MRPQRFANSGLVLTVVALTLTGCGTGGGTSARPGKGGSALRLPDPNRIDATLGQRIILPVDEPLLGAIAHQATWPVVEMPDGSRLNASLWRVRADPLPPLPAAADPSRPKVHLTTWLSGNAAKWSAVRVTWQEALLESQGIVLVIDPPAVNRDDVPVEQKPGAVAPTVVRRKPTRVN